MTQKYVSRRRRNAPFPECLKAELTGDVEGRGTRMANTGPVRDSGATTSSARATARLGRQGWDRQAWSGPTRTRSSRRSKPTQESEAMTLLEALDELIVRCGSDALATSTSDNFGNEEATESLGWWRAMIVDLDWDGPGWGIEHAIHGTYLKTDTDTKVLFVPSPVRLESGLRQVLMPTAAKCGYCGAHPSRGECEALYGFYLPTEAEPFGPTLLRAYCSGECYQLDLDKVKAEHEDRQVVTLESLAPLMDKLRAAWNDYVFDRQEHPRGPGMKVVPEQEGFEALSEALRNLTDKWDQR